MVTSDTNKSLEEQGKVFTGPLFVIGMPRSGTKLLRELLKGNPRIGVPSAETEFLPYWVNHWKKFGDLSERSRFEEFYRSVVELPYFIFMRNLEGVIQEKVWYELCQSYTPAGVFEALVRHDAGADYGSNTIWGDKSPGYTTHMPLLKSLFPDARFIHIIRDVRDYCLSLNRGWGKNMVRAAQRWIDGVTKASLDSKEFPEDYLEINYEKLLEDPEKELRRCCSFLDVEFNPAMLYISSSTENIGDTKGKKEVISTNQKKYLTLMDPNLRRKIEAITTPALKNFGYETDYSGEAHRVSSLEMTYFQVLDGFNHFSSLVQREGPITTLKIQWGSFMTSGYRN